MRGAEEEEEQMFWGGKLLGERLRGSNSLGTASIEETVEISFLLALNASVNRD
jgi:hypothetical protein